jgi:hypothetical protein
MTKDEVFHTRKRTTQLRRLGIYSYTNITLYMSRPSQQRSQSRPIDQSCVHDRTIRNSEAGGESTRRKSRRITGNGQRLGAQPFSGKDESPPCGR